MTNKLADKLIEEASQTVWEKPKRCTGVYRILIELMTNTRNHAGLEGEGSEPWHLCVVHIKEENKVIFTLVDYGIGVINSLQGKQKTEKFYGFRDWLAQCFGSPPSNKAIIREIFLDEQQVSSTGNYYRGYGLPSLYDSFKNGEIANLHYVTNNVHFNAVEKEFRSLSANFTGTFVYWELNTDCDHLNALQ